MSKAYPPFICCRTMINEDLLKSQATTQKAANDETPPKQVPAALKDEVLGPHVII